MRPFNNPVTRATIMTAAFVFAVAATVAAEPQRGGGSRHSGSSHFAGGGVQRYFNGGPRGHFAELRSHVRGAPRVIIRGGLFDPFWGFSYPYGYGYPYGYPYMPYDYSVMRSGSVKTEITPKQTEVYVDGYYAGVADDFDGAFQRLHTSPGGHAITLHLEGYRTVTQNIYVRPNATSTLTETMEKLAPGEVSEPVPVPMLAPGRSDNMAPAPSSDSRPQR